MATSLVELSLVSLPEAGIGARVQASPPIEQTAATRPKMCELAILPLCAAFGGTLHEMGVVARSCLVLGLILIACAPQPPPSPAAVGEPCEVYSDCEEALICFEAVCTDDSGPYLIYTDPAHLDAVAFGGTMYSLVGVNNRNFGDDVEYTFDPFGPSPTTQLLDWDDQYAGGYDDITLETPPTSGAHWLRVRVVDAEGTPYENPSATVIVMVFVRDELHPDKPQVGLLEPRPDRPHVAGTDLIYEIVVMPGSFSFSAYGGLTPCEPLPDCPDPFAPECEAECGPITRIGDAKVYLDEDFESCLPVEFPNCALDYRGEIEEYLDAFVARGQIDAEHLPEPGSHTFSAMLWYGYGPYPSQQAPIYMTQPLEIVGE